jgi:hypothetical protein
VNSKRKGEKVGRGRGMGQEGDGGMGGCRCWSQGQRNE